GELGLGATRQTAGATDCSEYARGQRHDAVAPTRPQDKRQDFGVGQCSRTEGNEAFPRPIARWLFAHAKRARTAHGRFGKKSFSSRSADSGESDPCTRFSVVMSP